MTSFESGFVDSRGVNIHYLTNHPHPSQKGAILFVPGVMMPAWIWEKQLEYFSKEYRVVAMDLRSHGKSERSNDGYYASALAGDIKAVADKLDLRPLILVGWSIGVPQVIQYALQYGTERLAGLVLVDGAMGMDSSLPFYQSTMEYWTQFQTDREAKTKEFVEIIFKQTHPSEYLERLYKSAMDTPTNTVMTMIYNYILMDCRPLLPKINVPTLITTVPGPRLDYMKQMHQSIAHSQFEIIEGAGHALFVDQPVQFNRLLKGFIDGLSEASVQPGQ